MASNHLKEFKKLLQENFKDTLQWDSRYDLALETCWNLYKTAFTSHVQFLMRMVDQEALKDVRLVLGGIGVWKICFRKPRVIAGRLSKVVGKAKAIPYLRFTPSVRFRRIMLKKFCGIALPIPISASTRARNTAARARQRANKPKPVLPDLG